MSVWREIQDLTVQGTMPAQSTAAQPNSHLSPVLRYISSQRNRASDCPETQLLEIHPARVGACQDPYKQCQVHHARPHTMDTLRSPLIDAQPRHRNPFLTELLLPSHILFWLFWASLGQVLKRHRTAILAPHLGCGLTTLASP